MCLIIDRNHIHEGSQILVDSKIRLKNTVHLSKRILPGGSIYTVKMNEQGFLYLKDAEGQDILDYYNVANFVKLN